MANQVEERRKHPRLRLRLNVAFKPSEREAAAEGKGTTSDVSAGGVCFETPDWADVNRGEQFEMRLSGFSRYGTGSLFRELHATATVLRTDPPEREAGPLERGRVAVRFDEPPHFEVYDWVEG